MLSNETVINLLLVKTPKRKSAMVNARSGRKCELKAEVQKK